MNHDCAHCLDETDACPESCFRKQLNEDLRKNPVPWVSWMHFRKDGLCQIEEEENG